MKFVYTLHFTLTIVLITIDLSSTFDCLPNGAPIPVVPHDDYPDSSDKISPRRMISTPESSSSVRSSYPPSRVQPPNMAIAPAMRLPSPDGKGCGFEQLSYIRLIPFHNPHKIFSLQRCTFPPNNLMNIKIGREYRHVLNQEHIVLSASNGDVFAIFKSFNVLDGLYTYESSQIRRAKINLKNGIVTRLTPEEVFQAPVGRNNVIIKNFKVVIMNQ